MLNSYKLFLECLKKPEPLVDDFYFYNKLIISEQRNSKTPIMKIQDLVLERVCAANIAKKEHNEKEYEKHIIAIDELLIKNDNTQFLELTSFFPTIDVSFSFYKRLEKVKRFKLLNKITKLYLDSRHSIYMSHGYSATTVQVRKDFQKHKVQGNFTNEKIQKICYHLGYKHINQDKPIQNQKHIFCFIDKKYVRGIINNVVGAKWYKKWSENHEGKQADILFKAGQNYFICEAKHIKEGGGGQDKQINELISFINNSKFKRQNNIFYIAFLDGIYFNSFINLTSPKVKTQRKGIERCLKYRNNQNFFVNTYGLKKLLKSIKNADS